MPEINGEHRLLAPDHPADRLLDALPVGGERCRRRTGPDAGYRDAIGRGQAVDERHRRLIDRHRPADPDVRLVHGEHDQPPAGRVLIRAVAVRRRRRRRRRVADQ